MCLPREEEERISVRQEYAKKKPPAKTKSPRNGSHKSEREATLSHL
jgi:hypothetical protein